MYKQEPKLLRLILKDCLLKAWGKDNHLECFILDLIEDTLTGGKGSLVKPTT